MEPAAVQSGSRRRRWYLARDQRRRQRAWHLKEQRYSHRQIAEELGITKQAVSRLLQRQGVFYETVAGMSKQAHREREVAQMLEEIAGIRPAAMGYVDDHKRPNVVPCAVCGAKMREVCAPDCPTRVVEPDAGKFVALQMARAKLHKLLGLDEPDEIVVNVQERFEAVWGSRTGQPSLPAPLPTIDVMPTNGAQPPHMSAGIQERAAPAE